MPWDLDDLEEDAEFATVTSEEVQRLQALTPTMKASKEPLTVVSTLDALESLDMGCWDEASPRQSAIIFLDVDGVLRSMDTPDGKEHEDKILLGTPQLDQLHRVVQATGARLVLTSELRLDMDYVEVVLIAFDNIGMRRPIGPTPDLQGAGRPTEINTWLSCNTKLVDSVRWVAIDTHLLTPDIRDEHFVKIDGLQGLTQERADEAIKKLEICKN